MPGKLLGKTDCGLSYDIAQIGGGSMKSITWSRAAAISVVVGVLLGVWNPLKIDAQDVAGKQVVDAPKFQVDPFWPKLLPDRWVFGRPGGVCVDAQYHVFVVDRGDISSYEMKTAKATPPVIDFDPDGNVANSWGNRDLMAKKLHDCTVDYQGNIWIGGSLDGMVQKYSHDGSKMLLQIGTKGRFDTSDDSITGAPMNSSHVYLNLPASVAVDPTNGDVYIADGYGNRRVVVFDREGHYLRQWGRQGTVAEADAGVGGVFLGVLHCVVMGNDGLIYVCDREGDRVQIFDKMGNFKRNIFIKNGAPHSRPGAASTIGFSLDPAQKFIYVGDSTDQEIRILDRATGKALSSFGRPGNQAGEFDSTHSLAVNGSGDIIVADSSGHRIQMWRLVK
jgi:DNA-binding beta-propeller fold protein YncE